jgi:pSer/pThr/pTyr-binding forkhead associated (FHA) protein
MMLYFRRGGREIPAIELGPKAVRIGRDVDNDLVLTDETVSGHHARAWIDGDRAFLRDPGSTNGTFVNDERAHNIVEIRHGDLLRLGMATELVVRGRTSENQASPYALMVEDIDAGARYQVTSDRFYFGSGPLAHMKTEGSEQEAALSFHPGGEVWLATYEEEGPVEVGEEFRVGGRRLRLVNAPLNAPPTLVTEAAVQFPYRLTVTLDGVSGPEAVLEDATSGTRHVVAAENRAVLLYVLAKRNIEARKRGEDVRVSEETWCNDEEVARDIWGKKGTSDANSLHVLVHRLRKEIKKAGFDPWFIEKRRKAIRVALQDVILT